jgi:hypothetical protein
LPIADFGGTESQNRQSAIGNNQVCLEYILMMRSIAARQTLQKWSVRENMMQSTSGR